MAVLRSKWKNRCSKRLHAREATLAYTRMVAAGALKGYEEFFVVAALGTGPLSIHMRLPVASLKDLKGKKIRAINPTGGA